MPARIENEGCGLEPIPLSRSARSWQSTAVFLQLQSWLVLLPRLADATGQDRARAGRAAPSGMDHNPNVDHTLAALRSLESQ